MSRAIVINIVVTGQERAIHGFVSRCLWEWDVKTAAPTFDRASPTPRNTPSRLEAIATEQRRAGTECIRMFLGKSVSDLVIISSSTGRLEFDFVIATPPVERAYRALGEAFPTLMFSIAAIDWETRWALRAKVAGARFEFDGDADPEEVYDRVFEGAPAG